MQPDLISDNIVNLSSAVWLGNDVYVIEVGKEFFPREELSVRALQCFMKPEAKERRHEGVPLLSSFSLMDIMGNAIVVGQSISALLSL